MAWLRKTRIKIRDNNVDTRRHDVNGSVEQKAAISRMRAAHKMSSQNTDAAIGTAVAAGSVSRFCIGSCSLRGGATLAAGIEAQLAIQSLVTGQLDVELDFQPDTPAVFVGEDPEANEIPAMRSDFDTFRDQLSQLRSRGPARRCSRFATSPS